MARQFSQASSNAVTCILLSSLIVPISNSYSSLSINPSSSLDWDIATSVLNSVSNHNNTLLFVSGDFYNNHLTYAQLCRSPTLLDANTDDTTPDIINIDLLSFQWFRRAQVCFIAIRNAQNGDGEWFWSHMFERFLVV